MSEVKKDESILLGRLLPCPFCGAGTMQIIENGKIWAGHKFSEPTSVSVRHWCEPILGQPSRMLERIGRDTESAVAAWNMRCLGVVFLAPEATQFADTCCDKPEDRMWHAADNTWWRRVGNRWVSAEAPPGWVFA